MMREEETTTCMGCGSQVKSADLSSSLPENGWKLHFDDFGYYSGFHDSFGEEESRPFIMCHDCVVKLLELFPRLAEMIGPGGHHCEDETPCCRHAWQSTEIFGTREFGVHTRTAWPDAVWHDNPPREGL